jgi:KUP system potassium uptake protein
MGFFALGSVFPAVTGAEAIYADMGHFGASRSRAPGSASPFRACS